MEWDDFHNNAQRKRLLETLNLILDLSKVEADKVQINYNEINISEEVFDIVNMLNPVAQKKNLYLKAAVKKKLFYQNLINGFYILL